jgi:hypothetical protein
MEFMQEQSMKSTKHSLGLAALVLALATACSPQLEVKNQARVDSNLDSSSALKTPEGSIAEVGEALNTVGDKKEDAASAVVDSATQKEIDLKTLLKSLVEDQQLQKFVTELEKKLNARCGIHRAQTTVVQGNDQQYTVLQEVSCTGMALTQDEIAAEVKRREGAAAAAEKTASQQSGDRVADLAAAVVHSDAVIKARAEVVAGQTRVYRIEVPGTLDLTKKTIDLDYTRAQTGYVIVEAGGWKVSKLE